MPARLVAIDLDEGTNITLDRTMVVVGRHPQCDARLDSLRVSRHHCCMTQDNGDVVVRDLGSTNGIRINGQRVEIGRLKPGDELSIAHIRYRLEGTNPAGDMTLADPWPGDGTPGPSKNGNGGNNGNGSGSPGAGFGAMSEFHEPLAAAVRERLPAGMADKCRIQVIVKMDGGEARRGGPPGMPARLVPLSLGSASGPVITLQRPVVLIGRHPECDARIDSPGVSRRHCCLALAYDRVMIRDLGSRNGLRVNGTVVDEAVLRPGDEVAIGPFLYRLEEPDAPARPAPAPAPVARPVPATPPPPVGGTATPPYIPTVFDADLDDLIPIDDD